ncbi:MAG TPA: cytochrome P450 [Acidimicrobiales bacterium]|nr:cytochrome P450 [Acidimicrobiales bacterium]
MTDTVDSAALDTVLAGIFLTPEGKQDPYPGYAQVREATAFHQSAFGLKVATRYDDVNAILRDNRFGRGENDLDPSVFGLTQEEFEQRFARRNEMSNSMLGMDPPDHPRLRSLVAKAFTPKTVEQLRPGIQRLTDSFLEPLEGEVDLMPALALKLPITVISEMLGVPSADHDALVPHIKIAVRSLATFEPNLEEFAEVYASMAVIGDYFTELAAEKRAHPDDGMFTELIHAEEEGDKLTEPELISTVILLFIAGYETTTNLIGNGTRALLLHPEQLQRLRDDRSLMKGTIEEILRWDSPVQLTARKALVDDIEVHGTPIAKGEEVITILGAANRDPRVYDDPDTFDISRKGPAPLSFSAGIHYCLGAALARAEGDIVFSSMLDRYRAIEPAWTALTYRDNLVLRGLESLPVQLVR